jgi:hypothetical protein
MQLTKGQKNRINSYRWRLFIAAIEVKAKVRILCIFKAGQDSSYSFQPGGEGLAWDDKGAVAMFLQRTVCPEIELPKYGAPYTEEEILLHPKY